MNKHVELVKRWLAGEDVTTEELRANSIAAVSRAHAAGAAANAADHAAHAAARDADAANAAAVEAARDADTANAAASDAAAYAASAAYWVKRYEELINETL